MGKPRAKIENLLFKPEWMDGGTIYDDKIYFLVYEFENNWHYKKQCKYIFHVIIKNNAPLIFGNSILQKELLTGIRKYKVSNSMNEHPPYKNNIINEPV